MQTGRQTASQPASQPDRQTGRQAGRQTDRQTNRQTDRQTGRQAGRQTDRQAGSCKADLVNSPSHHADQHPRYMFRHPRRANAQMRSRSFYGAGNASQSILLDEVRCSGSENNIFYCSHDALGSNDCQHNEDVGVLCAGSTVGEYADRRVRIHSRWDCRSMSTSVAG